MTEFTEGRWYQVRVSRIVFGTRYAPRNFQLELAGRVFGFSKAIWPDLEALHAAIVARARGAHLPSL